MSERTPRFQLSTLGPGDAIQDDGYKFSDDDIRLIDRLLAYALEQHVHTGAAAGDDAPQVAPSLVLHATGGTHGAGTRIYYKTSFVDENDNETAASPLAFVDTPAVVAEPTYPALSWDSTGGTLPPGSYTYVLSAYRAATTLETKALNPARVRLNVTTSTSQITLTMPSAPVGMDGWNIYRKRPGSPRFYLLASTTDPTYIADGTVTEDTGRTLPVANTTNNTSAVTITLPGATPTAPEGYTWNIYRSYDATNWDNSLLHHVIETTDEDGGPIVTTFDDVGEATFRGMPLDTNQTLGSPPKIDLTDMANVTGTLPPGVITTAHVVSFRLPGPVTPQILDDLWVCNFDRVQLVGARAYLGWDFVASTEIVVDVDWYDGTTWETVFTDQDNRPTIAVDEQIGELSPPPDVVDLEAGNALRVDIDLAAGATPVEENLTVDVLMYVQHGSTTESVDWLP